MLTTLTATQKPLIIEATRITPKVVFDASQNEFSIAGVCYPEDSLHFFTPIHEYLDNCAYILPEKVQFEFKLDYFNTSSARQIVSVMHNLNRLFKLGKDILVKWHYVQDDRDLKEVGEEFKLLVDVPIELVTLPNSALN